MIGFDKKWEYMGVRVKEAENYILSLLLDVNLWAIFCNYQDSHSARRGPVFGELSCRHCEVHTPDFLNAVRTRWVTDYRQCCPW